MKICSIFSPRNMLEEKSRSTKTDQVYIYITNNVIASEQMEKQT